MAGISKERQVAICRHSEWLRIGGCQKLTLCDTGRMGRVVQEMTNPSSQTPSVVFFIGRQTKAFALQHLFSLNAIAYPHSEDLVTFHVEPESSTFKHPLFLADGDTTSVVSQRQAASSCHETTEYPTRWSTVSSHDVVDFVFARLFFLFSDVVVLFADDFPSPRHLFSRILKWVKLGSASTLPLVVRSKMIILFSAAYTGEEIKEFHDLVVDLETAHVFSTIAMLTLSEGDLSAPSGRKQLKDLIHRQCSEMQKIRQEHECLFSATHLSAFYREAIRHTSETLFKPFSFIDVSRQGNAVSLYLSQHIATSLNLAAEYKLSYENTTSFIASAILMDAYPPGMHLFHSNDVFQRLYKPSCLHALSKHYDAPDFVVVQCDDIENELRRLYSLLKSKGLASSRIRRDCITSQATWTYVKTHQICLYCLMRRPEHFLSCRHGMCDVCVRIFGLAVPHEESLFKIVPPTSGYRVVSIDGGGTKGPIPLENLILLQKELGPKCRLQDSFDLAFGTSIGGLIILWIFLQQRDPSECQKLFGGMMRRFFCLKTKKGLISQLQDYFRCFLSDGYYDNDNLESALKETFGDSCRMFDTCDPLVSGLKVAVTATTISDASTFVISNYNGVKNLDSECGYQHLRPERPENEIKVWEAGRATSAAPVMVRPAYIEAIGAFQDGGLKHNNPINLALWEGRRIWPKCLGPDVVLSLGTGTPQDGSSSLSPHFRHVYNDGFVPRLYRSFMSMLDGESTWRGLKNGLNEPLKNSYFRLNVGFPGKEPRLDDVTVMDNFRNIVNLKPNGLAERQEIASALLISSFFLVLDSAPWYQAGLFRCQGSIRCRQNPIGVLQALRRIHASPLEFATDTEVLSKLTPNRNLCCTCQRYCKRVTFAVRHKEEPFTIYLQGETLPRRKIGGFPQSLLWFIEQQCLNADFGSADHRSLENKNCGCGSRPRRSSRSQRGKRTTPLLETPYLQKKRRVDEESN